MKANRRTRNAQIDVMKHFGDVLISLERRSVFEQRKGILYKKMGSVSKGKLKLPMPLSELGKKTHRFVVMTDGSLKHLYSVSF